MLLFKPNRSWVRRKDAYLVTWIRKWYWYQRHTITRREQQQKPLGLWLYLFQNFVIDRTDYLTLANVISLFRGLLAYPYYILFMAEYYTAALIVLAAGLMSDFVDGIIAKGFYQETETGKKADPFFDKVLIGTVGYCLYTIGILPPWLLTSILALESLLILMAMVLKPLATALGLERASGANDFGKWKFVCQCTGLSALLLSVYFAPSGLMWYFFTYLGYLAATVSLPFAICSIIEHALPGSLISPKHVILKITIYLKRFLSPKAAQV